MNGQIMENVRDEIEIRIKACARHMDMHFHPDYPPAEDYWTLAVLDLWGKCFDIAKRIPADSADQDALVIAILQIRNRGSIRRINVEGAFDGLTDAAAAGLSEAVIITENMMWTDLPLFALEMEYFWVGQCAGMSTAQRISVSRFLAKLASVGIEKLCSIASMLFRDTFETPRNLIAQPPTSGYYTIPTIANLSVAELLPSVLSWLQESQGRAGGFDVARLNDDAADIETSTPDGDEDPCLIMHPPRHRKWWLWARKARAISREAEAAGHTELADLAQRVYRVMIGEGLLPLPEASEVSGDDTNPSEADEYL